MKKLFFSSLVLVAVASTAAVFIVQRAMGQAGNPLIQSMVSANPTMNFEVLNILGKLEASQIDAAFFESPLFQSLQDFSLQVVEEPVGRKDPFSAPDSAQ